MSISDKVPYRFVTTVIRLFTSLVSPSEDWQTRFFTHPLEKKSEGVMSRDLGSHAVGFPLSIHRPGNYFSPPNSKVMTSLLRCTCIVDLNSVNQLQLALVLVVKREY
ncbi:hypothetical protein TNCV_3741641 [Trichonephila clavipes]|nr:hypothetical protein TNCV_3741641 [Trichonephila clavipes]